MNMNLLVLIPYIAPLVAKIGWAGVSALALLGVVVVAIGVRQLRMSKGSGSGGSGAKFTSWKTAASGSKGKTLGYATIAIVLLLVLAWGGKSFASLFMAKTKTVEIKRVPATEDGPRDVFDTQSDVVIFLAELPDGTISAKDASFDGEKVTLPEKAELLFKVKEPRLTGLGAENPGEKPFRRVAWKNETGWQLVQLNTALAYPKPGQELHLIDYYKYSIGVNERGEPDPVKQQVTRDGAVTDAFVELVVVIELDENRLGNYKGTSDELLRYEKGLAEKVRAARSEFIANMSDPNFQLQLSSGNDGKKSCKTQADAEVRKANAQILTKEQPFKLTVTQCTYSQ